MVEKNGSVIRAAEKRGGMRTMRRKEKARMSRKGLEKKRKGRNVLRARLW